MSKKITIQNKPELPPWALTDLVLISRKFHCHINIHNNEITIDAKKMLEVISLVGPDLSRIEIRLNGKDEKEAFKSILNSNMGRFILRRSHLTGASATG